MVCIDYSQWMQSGTECKKRIQSGTTLPPSNSRSYQQIFKKWCFLKSLYKLNLYKKKFCDQSNINAIYNFSKLIYRTYERTYEIFKQTDSDEQFYLVFDFQSQNYQEDFGLQNCTKQRIIRDILTKNKNLDKVISNI